MIPNNGYLSEKFEQHSQHFTGNKTATAVPASKLTQLRTKAMQNIYDAAKAQNVPVDTIITGILTDADPEVTAYIVSEGETPITDPTAKQLQAVLLRANQIATVASTLDISDDEALEQIEGAEQQYVDNNTADASNVLPPLPAGAVSCALAYLSAGYKDGNASMGDLLQSLKQTAAVGSVLINKGTASNFIGSRNGVSDPSDWQKMITPSKSFNSVDDSSEDEDIDPDLQAALDQTSTPDASPASINTSLASIPVTGTSTGTISGTTSVAATVPTIANSASNLPQASSSTSSGGLLNSITSLLAGVNTVAQQVSTTGTTLSKAVNTAGAGSIATYVQNNQSTILIIVVLIVFVIAAAIYAGKHHS